MHSQRKGDFFVFFAATPQVAGELLGPLKHETAPQNRCLTPPEFSRTIRSPVDAYKPYTESTTEDRLTCKDRENPDECSSPFDCRYGVCDLCGDNTARTVAMTDFNRKEFPMSRLEFAIDQICTARQFTEKLIDSIDPAEWFRQPSERDNLADKPDCSLFDAA